MSHPLFGWYDDPAQPVTAPTYDPGWESTPCLVCTKPLNGPNGIRTYSLMRVQDPDRSWFYRLHIACDDRLSEDDRGRIEESVLWPTPEPRS